MRTHLWKGHLLFLYSQEASAAARGFLPTLLIHPVEILSDRAADSVQLIVLSPEQLFARYRSARRAIQGSLRPGGEKKHCTVLYTDIRGFTRLSESHQPEEVVDFLNRYFTAMVDSVTVTDGVVDKFIGTAIMAHWGAILPQSTALTLWEWKRSVPG